MDEQPPSHNEQNPKSNRPVTPESSKKPALANTQNSSRDTQATDDAHEPAPYGFWSNPNHWIAIASVAMAISSILYTYFALRQWDAMLESNRINSSSLISVQRAFVTFKGFENDRVINPSNKRAQLRFTAVYENIGTTPAANVIGRFFVDELTSEPDREKFKGFQQNHGPSTIGPKDQRQSWIVFTPDFVTEHIPSVPGYRRYLWGWITYNNIFPGTRPHVTEFCQVLTRVYFTKIPGKEWMFDWDPCTQHNCTDEYCDDYENIVKAK